METGHSARYGGVGLHQLHSRPGPNVTRRLTVCAVLLGVQDSNRQCMLLIFRTFSQFPEYPYHQKYQRDFDVEVRVEGPALDLQAGVSL